MAEVKLIGSWGSPFVMRVHMMLKLKGVEYEYIEEDLQNKSAILLKYNPISKQVPVLVHNGKPICESAIILEYIDEVWEGPSLIPKDPYQKAQARFWSNFINEKCNGALFKACFSKGEDAQKAKEEAADLLKFLENELEGKKFFGGDKIGLVDISANFIPYWARIVGELVGLQLMTEDKFPNLCKWADEFVNDSFVKENLPPKDKLVATFKGMIQGQAQAH